MGRKEELKGVVVGAVTPTTPDYEVDCARFREHLRFILDGGVRNGLGVLLAAGGGGEGDFLSDDQWREVVEILAEEAAGQVPTMVGVFELNTRRAIDKVTYAEERGIDFVQLAPPHAGAPADSEVFAHYRLVNEAVTEIGLVVYHSYWALPGGYEMTPPLIARLADLDHVVGIKWGSSSLKNFMDVLFGFGDRFAFVDFHGWTAKIREPAGMDAFFFLPGNYDPPGAVRVAELFLAGEWEQFAREWTEGMAVREAVRIAVLEEVYGSAYRGKRTLAGGTVPKATMDVVGRPMGPAFPPQHNLSDEAKSRIARQFGIHRGRHA